MSMCVLDWQLACVLSADLSCALELTDLMAMIWLLLSVMLAPV